MSSMQLAGVHRPLMSVARICDAGHQVVITRTGGYIQHDETGQTTPFYRGKSVYRMEVETVESEVGFAWQMMTPRASFLASPLEEEGIRKGKEL